MLELKDIRKQYGEGDYAVHALSGVSLKFRENEFVSILGASGCGKTTLLNIVGGLDRYTSGDLVINGKSTKDFKDADWDTYRNHSIGFVFQSYNLIPHQTVLSNVELALTLSGVSKSERRARAVEALKKVGLGDQIHKKPNQMSGGQMQRVAIARALVNNPDILLADEPTGALDTTTSVQIMDLLKEVAQEKLVIMVTHNPDLAEQYSTRIVRLSDGKVIDDTDPYDGEEPKKEPEMAVVKVKDKKAKDKKAKKKSMSFPTAVSLSFNNLLTKKARTILTSFAGSIGIIGIALILSLSNGIQAYIDRVQEDTLSTYPLTIQKETQDFSAMLSAMTEVSELEDTEIDPNKIYVDDSLGTMMSAMSATVSNDLEKFKAYIEEHYDELEDSVSDIQYTYDFDLQIFTEDGKTQVSPTEIFDNMGDAFAGISEMMDSMGGFGIMSEMINNQALLDQQYELVGENSHWPENPNEVVLVVGKNNQISKMTLYMLGVLPQDELEDIMKELMTEGTYESSHMEEYTLDDFLGMKFRMLNTADFFEKTDKTYEGGYHIWNDLRDDVGFDREKFVTENGTELVISGIIRPRDGATATSIAGAVGYTKALTDMILEMNAESEVINQQKATPDYNVLTGLKFERTHYTPETISQLVEKVDSATMEQFYAYMTQMIKESPEFSLRLNVTQNSFAEMFMLMPDQTQAELVTAMLTEAKGNPDNTVGLMTLFGTLSAITENKIAVDENNLVMLLPIMSPIQKMVIAGFDFSTLEGVEGMEGIDLSALSGVPSLASLAGEAAMTPIYKGMTDTLMEMTVNEEIFVRLLSTMKATDDEFIMLEETLYNLAPQTDATLESTLKLLGDAEKASPMSINFYAKDFESKDNIEAFIANYNDTRENETEKVQYTDLIGIMMSSVSLIINVISYVLIAFVSISLVVSSIMIGIITYISVLERTKEIGVLRSIGASKKDISRVFNAETLIVGFAAGLIGIVSTIVLCIPINAIIHAVSGIDSVSAVLPWVGGVALILISMILTFIAGLIPSRLAAKKDPVEALRTE